MKEKISLNGEWGLYYFSDYEQDVSTPAMLKAAEKIAAKVPGNAELDMAAAGLIPSELYRGMATEENIKLEDYAWWYEKRFTIDAETENKNIILSFGAVDCFAEYFINGERVHKSENAFTEIRVDITEYYKPGEENVLHVHILPTAVKAFEHTCPQYLQYPDGKQMFIRKPAHSFGWDIFPRTVSAGIWKDVNIELDDGYSIEDISYSVMSASRADAKILFRACVRAPYKAFKKKTELRISGVCGDSEFTYTQNMNNYRIAVIWLDIKNPKLWWPYGYGEANVYDVTCEFLIDGEVVDSCTMNLGIRTAELKRTDTLKEENHCFQFVINGKNIMCRGSNWVPLDAYHSRDKERYARALELVSDTHCNMLRVWGGGVYEQEEFYDYCDRHGIMVWQDFMAACRPVAMDEETMANFRAEAEWAVRTLRHHPSIVLWAGDNEIDEGYAMYGKRPGFNRVNRELLPQVVEENDTGRAYLASSPFISDKAFADYIEADNIPERHLWGARDYFKADFYKFSKAHFVSETGYHGCPNVESLKKMLSEDKIWPIFNEEWCLHSSDFRGDMYRVQLMWEQVKQLFDFEPQNIEDFSLASQISQAEGKKYFIERVRIKKPYTSGILWWNILDGWPQMSDAVVDYYFDKKLAYYYIRNSQKPFAIMMDELQNWHYDVVASNDTFEEISGSCRVFDIDSGETVVEADFTVEPNSNLKIGAARIFYPEKRFLVIEWSIGGKTYYNHYLCGSVPFDFETYKGWIKKFMEYVKTAEKDIFKL